MADINQKHTGSEGNVAGNKNSITTGDNSSNLIIQGCTVGGNLTINNTTYNISRDYDKLKTIFEAQPYAVVKNSLEYVSEQKAHADVIALLKMILSNKEKEIEDLINAFYNTNDKKKKKDIKETLASKIDISDFRNDSDFITGIKKIKTVEREKEMKRLENLFSSDANDETSDKPKTAVILVGDTGTGKSTLLAKFYLRKKEEDNKCLYLAASTINFVNQQNGAKKLEIKGANMPQIFTNFDILSALKLINIILFDTDKNFFLFFDAINENENSKELFDTIFTTINNVDDKLEKIKIVLSTRLITYKTIIKPKWNDSPKKEEYLGTIKIGNYTTKEFNKACDNLNDQRIKDKKKNIELPRYGQGC